ncbi:hypothetical protein K1719_020990 [Acacia pycnantha]|nr:hypothetical protein K1719_020990 [Acacia pycnantha]
MLFHFLYAVVLGSKQKWVFWVLQPGMAETQSEQEGRQNFRELLDLSLNCRPLGFFEEGWQHVYVGDPKVIKELNRAKPMDLGRPTYVFKPLKPLLGSGILTVNGAPWYFQRNLIAPEFSLFKIQIILDNIGEANNKKQKVIVDMCSKNIYFAGSETTAVLLTWTLILLRLYGPGPGITSGAKRTNILVFITVMHRDMEIWGEDANEFKPERFEGGHGYVRSANQRQYIYISVYGYVVLVINLSSNHMKFVNVNFNHV